MVQRVEASAQAIAAGPGRPFLPGRDLLHPLALVALLVLILNDHFLKQAFPSALTGKLSDVAGLILLPLLIRAAYEWFREVLPSRSGRESMPVWVPAAATAAVFSSIQLSEWAASVYETSLGFLQWLPAAAVASLSGESVPPMLTVSKVLDPTDLLVLPVVLIPAWIASRPIRSEEFPTV